MSGCGSSRPVPAARRKAWVSIKHPAPLQPARVARRGPEAGQDAGQGKAGQGRAGQGGGPGRPGAGGRAKFPFRVPQTRPDPKHANGEGFGVYLYCLTRGGVTTVLVYREALPSLTVLSRRSAGGLGPRAPMQMVSGALGSLGIRVIGLRV